MSRAHYLQTITDPEGNLITNATVTVYDPDTFRYLAQTLWVSDSGTTPLPNPIPANNGTIEFYLDKPDRVLLGIDVPGFSSMQFYADVLPPADRLILSDTPIHFSDTPKPGKIVQVAADGSLGFTDLPIGLSPSSTVKAWPLTGASAVPSDWTFSFSGTGVSSSYHGEIASDTVSSYTQVYRFGGNALGTVSSTPLVMNFSWSATLTDLGTLSFWYKLAGDSTLSVLVDGLSVFTTNSSGSYISAEIDSIAAGSRTITFRYSLTGNTAGSEVRLAGITLMQGGVVTPHYHDGTGPNSVALGQQSLATKNDATAVGDSAAATGADSTAIGFGAQAVADFSTAVGSSSSSVSYGVAIGYGAVSLGTNAIATGASANASHVGSIAVGYQATTSSDYGIAIGYQAVSNGDPNSIAIGRSAAAHAAGSIAFGANSSVDQSHTNSVALGANVSTTDANQIMVGNQNYTTLMSGALRVLGDATIGSSTSKVGFYGTIGTTKPTINGSKNGNVALGSLISSLSALGLITDNTTQ